jgi:hypothetical protein
LILKDGTLAGLVRLVETLVMVEVEVQMKNLAIEEAVAEDRAEVGKIQAAAAQNQVGHPVVQKRDTGSLFVSGHGPLQGDPILLLSSLWNHHFK